MAITATKSICDVCGRKCLLSEAQHECYRRIPAKIDPIWHPSFSEAQAKREFFGPEARKIVSPAWRPFSDIPEEVAAPIPRRMLLSKADEAELFLRYNYARFRLRLLADKQGARPTKARALAMLEWDERTRELRDALVNANLSLVVAMAKRTRIPNVDFPDLISEGNMALLRAIDKFDVSRGFKFSTYACRAILKGFNRMATKAGTYQRRFGVSYDPEMERSDYDIRRHKTEHDRAVDDVREVIDQNRARLSRVEKTVVTERFGLNGSRKKKTLSEVGKKVHLSTERVRQVQKTALAKIRQALTEQLQPV